MLSRIVRAMERGGQASARGVARHRGARITPFVGIVGEKGFIRFSVCLVRADLTSKTTSNSPRTTKFVPRASPPHLQESSFHYTAGVALSREADGTCPAFLAANATKMYDQPFTMSSTATNSPITQSPEIGH